MSKNSFNVANLAKQKGNEAFENGEYATARLLYSQAMEIDPSKCIYPLNRAIANLKLERWRDAEIDATAAIQLAPDNMEAFFRRGLAFTEMHQWNQARQDIQAFLDGGGCSVKGQAVLDAITDLEKVSVPNPISDKSNDSCKVFEDFPPDDVPGLAIRDSKVNGKGVFATREYKSGDTILREKPLLVMHPTARRNQPAQVEAALRKMSPEITARFLSLYNAHTGDCCADLPLASHRAFEIFDSNNIGLHGPHFNNAVCFYASRFNHSCSPKTRCDFDTATGEFRLCALDPIHEGEEIFRCYTFGSSQEMHCATRAWRQDELRKWFHFTCVCALCTLPDTVVQASDERRVRIGELMDNIPKIDDDDDDLLGVLSTFVEGALMAQEEGCMLHFASITFMTYAMAVCVLHSDHASAKYWMEAICQIISLHEDDKKSRQKEVRKSCEEDISTKLMSELMSVPNMDLPPHKDCSKFRLDKSLSGGVVGEREKS